MENDKIIDEVIEILELMGQYVPTTPPNPLQPLIAAKIVLLKAERAKHNAKFLAFFSQLSQVVSQINNIKT